MKVWALSPFLNELDVLEIRLAELDEVVDVFVLVEATSTHSGIPRDLVWLEHRDRFAPWLDKIRYAPIDFPPHLNAEWHREAWQREYCGWLLAGLGMDDIVMISDLDEIPRASTVTDVVEGAFEIPCSISFPIHPYRLDWKWDQLEDGFCRCTFVRGSALRPRRDGGFDGVHEQVVSAHRFSYVGEYGWHFSYIGSEEQIITKAESIADAWVKGTVSEQHARESIRTGRDLFGRPQRTSSRVAIEDLPRHVAENRERFAHLLIDG